MFVSVYTGCILRLKGTSRSLYEAVKAYSVLKSGICETIHVFFFFCKIRMQVFFYHAKIIEISRQKGKNFLRGACCQTPLE